MARLYVDLVVDSLTEYSYDADLACLSYDLHAQLGNFVLAVDGYNDKLPVLHKVVMERFTKLTIDPMRFELIKEQVSRHQRSRIEFFLIVLFTAAKRIGEFPPRQPIPARFFPSLSPHSQGHVHSRRTASSSSQYYG